jgi:hypothetical protein
MFRLEIGFAGREIDQPNFSKSGSREIQERLSQALVAAGKG